MKTTVANNIHNQKLHLYLQNLHWDTTHRENKELELMLAASCLRYLGDIENLSFVLELSNHIQRSYQKTLNTSLLFATRQLHDLSEKLQKDEIASPDTTAIKKTIAVVLEMLTGIQYPFA